MQRMRFRVLRIILCVLVYHSELVIIAVLVIAYVERILEHY